MKKNQKVIVGVFTIIGTFVVSISTASAETAGSNGTVKFEESQVINPTNPTELGLIKPGTPDTFISVDQTATGEGVSTKGALRFSNAPSFKFGSAKISSTSMSYDAEQSKYKLWDKTTGKTVGSDIKIPQFIQVVDERGQNSGFKVTATASTFKSGATDELKNTRIQFYGATLRNNVLDGSSTGGKDADASTLLVPFNKKTIDMGTDALTELNSTAIMIFQTKAKMTSNASISSLIFAKDYTSSKDYSTEAKNKDIKLYVPNGEKPKKDLTYTATITWNLEDSF